MRTDLVLVASAEPDYRRAYDPTQMHWARFDGEQQLQEFRDLTLRGPPLAQLDGALLNVGNLAARFVDQSGMRATPAAVHYPDGQPPDEERPQVARSMRYLNGIYLAEFLGRHGFVVELINHLEEDLDLLREALDRDPVAMALSTTFLPNRGSVDAACEKMKALRPELPLIIGGPAVSQSYRVSQQQDYAPWLDPLRNYFLFLDRPQDPPTVFDYAVVDRRGEETLLQLLTTLRGGDDVRRVPNLGVRQADGSLAFTTRKVEDYDATRHAVRWQNVPDEHLGEAVSVPSSSGCPFRCRFCNFDSYKLGMGIRPPAEVAKDLIELQARGMVKRAYFTDDILFADREHMRVFCETMRDAGVELDWGGFARIDMIKPADVPLLRAGRGSFLNCGIESGSPEVLRNMLKSPRPQAVLDTMFELNRHGIWTNSAYIVGFPGETAETVDETIAFLNSYPTGERALNFYATYVFNVQPFAGVLQERERFGLEGMSYDWTHATMDVTEAVRQHRRIDMSVDGAVLAYPGDVAGLARYINDQPDSYGRFQRIIKMRKQVERLQASGEANGALSAAVNRLGGAVREAVAACGRGE